MAPVTSQIPQCQTFPIKKNQGVIIFTEHLIILVNNIAFRIPYQLEYYKNFNISMQLFPVKLLKQYQQGLKFSYQTGTRKLPMRSSVNMEQDMQALERDLCWIMVELANSDQRERDTATQWRSEEGAGRSHGALKVSRNFVVLY